MINRVFGKEYVSSTINVNTRKFAIFMNIYLFVLKFDTFYSCKEGKLYELCGNTCRKVVFIFPAKIQQNTYYQFYYNILSEHVH